MTVVDPRAGLSLLFNEQADSLSPSDGTGNFSDFDPSALTAMPVVVSDTTTGFARLFSSDTSDAITSNDAGDAVKSSRALSIVALLSLDVTAQYDYGQAGVLIQRAEGGATDWSLNFDVVDAATLAVKMSLSWHDESGVAVSDVGVEFTWHVGETYFVAAVREVIDGQLACRYFVNGEEFDGGTTALDVYDAVTGDVWVGYNSLTVAQYLNATVEAVEVYAEPISPQELAWVWRMMTIDRPDGAAALRALVPPEVYSTDEDSSIQRELAVQGAGIGTIRGFARRLRDNLWPSESWGVVLENHEKHLGLPPGPSDSLALRQTRVGDAYGAVLGFSVPDVKTQLENAFDLDSSDIEILEFDNEFSPAFTSDEEDYIGDQGDMVLSFAGGALEYACSASDADFDTYSSRAGWIVWPVANEVDAWVSGTVKVRTPASETAMGCLLIGSRVTDEWLLFGLNQEDLIRYATFTGGVLSAWTTIAADHQEFLRVRCLGDGVFELRYGLTSAAADAAVHVVISGGPKNVQWAGFTATSYDGSSITGTVGLEKFLIHAPNGPQRFNWYAYRDPALPGNPDMEGANLIVKRLKPAHTFAAAITQKSMLCDDVTRGCDREPIGK